jgi:hypothetical protein
VQGKVLVFAANSLILLTLALLGGFLSLQLSAMRTDCADRPDATCERSLVTAEHSLTVSLVLGAAAIVLAIVAVALQRRQNQREKTAEATA